MKKILSTNAPTFHNEPLSWRSNKIIYFHIYWHTYLRFALDGAHLAQTFWFADVIAAKEISLCNYTSHLIIRNATAIGRMVVMIFDFNQYVVNSADKCCTAFIVVRRTLPSRLKSGSAVFVEPVAFKQNKRVPSEWFYELKGWFLYHVLCKYQKKYFR